MGGRKRPLRTPLATRRAQLVPPRTARSPVNIIKVAFDPWHVQIMPLFRSEAALPCLFFDALRKLEGSRIRGVI